MASNPPTLHIICGKIAAGKSTLAATLGNAPHTVLICEDDWLAALYAGQMATVSDYVRCSARLQKIIGPHVVDTLKAGASVVLDFPANTVENRNWMRGIINTAQVDHQLHVLDVPDAVCLERLHRRNSDGDHAFAATDEQFQLVSKYFTRPGPEEGFNVVMHQPDGKP